MALLTRDELKGLATRTDHPCVSVYMPTHRGGPDVRQDPIRWKNLLRSARDELDPDDTEAQKVIDDGMELLEDGALWRHLSDGLAAFLAPGIQRLYRVPLRFDERVSVGRRFQITPLVPLLTDDGSFYLLALSQGAVRLYEATRHGVRQLERDDIPESLADAVGYDWEERSLQFYSGAPTNGGGVRETMFHGQGAGGDTDDREVRRFLQLVDSGVRRLIAGRDMPLVVASVEDLFGEYRKISQIQTLVDQPVPGNPDERTPEALRDDAWELIKPRLTAVRDEAAEQIRNTLGTGRSSRILEEVGLAAADGRVQTVFVAEGEQLVGRFDPEERVVREDAAADEDLLDRIAVETLAHGGTVYMVPPDELPGDGPAPVAALFRY